MTLRTSIIGTTALVIMLLMLAAVDTNGSAATTCTGKHVYAGADLASVASSAPSGTTFCVHQGMYRVSQAVSVQSGDRFIGVYSSFPRPTVTTTQARQVLNAGGSNGATIQGLRVEGAVGDESCQPLCGRGISGGTNLTVKDVRATLNANQGIGGAEAGLLVRGSVVDRNGSAPFAQQTGRETAAGVKSANSMTILNSNVHHNYWAGVWCDDNCGTLLVKNSKLTGNGKAGIHTEVSVGPQTISGNVIQGNGHKETWSLEAGLLINSVRDVQVYDNTFGNNRNHGVRVVDDDRWPYTDDISVRYNVRNGDAFYDCSLSGVNCYNNR